MKLLSVTNTLGDEVASISATGSAKFVQVETDKFAVSNDPNATQSATLTGISFNSNASAGQATIPQGSKEITLINPNIKAESLVFTTLTSPSQFNLYVKSQADGQAIIGFDTPTPNAVTFNWWLVGLTAAR